MITLLDTTIIVIYFIVVITVGIVLGRREKNMKDFIVGGRSVPWIPILFSIIATEVSAATFLATPALGFSENFNYLQFGLGGIVGRIFVAYIFLTVFYTLNCYTVYQYLEHRFGPITRSAAVLLFLVMRILGSGVRLLIASSAFSILFDIPFVATLMLFTLAAVIYTIIGGIKAIIWTDVIQACVFIIAGLTMIAYLLTVLGFAQIWDFAQQAGKLEIFHWQPSQAHYADGGWSAWFSDPLLIYLALLNSFFTTTAAFGTDQDMAQRMLTGKNVQHVRFSLILSGIISLPIAACFLFIGLGLYAFYQIYPDPALPQILVAGQQTVNAEQIFPHFIRYVLPSGLKGLLLIGVIAVAMSSLDSAMGALGSIATVDLYKRFCYRNASERHYLMMSRIFVLIFAIILAAVAYSFKGSQSFIWLVFKVASIGYGALLGVFLAGLLTNRGTETSNLTAIISSCLVTVTLLLLIENNLINLAWTWIIIIGTLVTFTLSICWRNPHHG